MNSAIFVPGVTVLKKIILYFYQPLPCVPRRPFGSCGLIAITELCKLLVNQPEENEKHDG